MVETDNVCLLALAGNSGAGKDTFYETVLMPRGYVRLQMTLYRKLWLVSTQQASWDDIFYDKPPHVRQLLQQDVTQVRYD